MGRDELAAVLQGSFDVLYDAMQGPSILELDQRELIHLVEAASHLSGMVEWAKQTAIPVARERGASWPMLWAAMGVSSATAQNVHDKSVAKAEATPTTQSAMTPAARAYAKLAAEKPVPLPSKEVPAGYDVRWPHKTYDLLKRPAGGTGPGVDRPV